MASEGLRVLGVARAVHDEGEAPAKDQRAIKRRRKVA